MAKKLIPPIAGLPIDEPVKETTKPIKLDINKINDLIATAKSTYKKYSADWDTHKAYYDGKQWSTTSYSKGDLVDNDGNLLWDISSSKSILRNPQLPRRTRNIIFPTIETEVGLLTDLNPTVRAIPMIPDENTKDATIKFDLFFKQIFNKTFQREYNKVCRDVCIYGMGYMHIYFSPTATAKHEIPFKLRREKPRLIQGEGIAE